MSVMQIILQIPPILVLRSLIVVAAVAVAKTWHMVTDNIAVTDASDAAAAAAAVPVVGTATVVQIVVVVQIVER
jgi:hypothetical protein